MSKNDNTDTVVVQVVKDFVMQDDYPVKLSVQGAHHAESTYVQWRNKRATIQKIDKERYVVMSSGEIKEFEHGDKKRIPELIKTFARLKGLIRTNFEACVDNQLFVTLTYVRNMKDPRQLYVDYVNFFKRLKYEYPSHQLDYIAVAEPQGRGAWHMHVMLKSDKPVLYISNQDMERIWRNGMTDTVRLKSDDVGQYYVAYFTDLVGTGDVKKRQKGARLSMYPPNFKFYRTSQGIKQPTEIETEWADVTAMYGAPIHTSTVKITKYQIGDTDDKGKEVNLVAKSSFKRV